MTSNMIKYCVVSENPTGEHDRSTCSIAKIYENDVEKFIESKTNSQCKVFDLSDDAINYLNQIVFDYIKDHTKQYNRDGLPTQSIPFRCKYVLVYVGDDVTPYPDIYKMSLNDFITLKSNFNSIKLANSNEIECCGDNSVIVSKYEAADILETINLSDTIILKCQSDSNISVEEMHKFDFIHNKLITYASTIKNVTKCLADTLTEFDKIQNDLLVCNEKDVSDEQKEKSVCHLNELRKSIKLQEKEFLLNFANEFHIDDIIIKNYLIKTLIEIKELILNDDSYEEILNKISVIF